MIAAFSYSLDHIALASPFIGPIVTDSMGMGTAGPEDLR